MRLGTGLALPLPRGGGFPALSLGFFQMLNATDLASTGTAFTRGSLATQYDSAGNLTWAPNNLITWSEGTVAQFESGSSNVSDAAATLTGFASSIQYGDNSVQRYGWKSTPSTPAGTYIFSGYVQMDDGGAPTASDFETVNTGGSVTPTFQQISGALYRFSAVRVQTTSPVGTVCGVRKQTNQSARTFRVAGLQLEIVTYQTTPRPYVATTSATYYAPRFDYDPTTLAARGLLIEESRTNSIRNNTMQGAVVGDVELAPSTLSSAAGVTGLAGWTNTNTGGSSNTWTWNGSAATVTGDGLTTALLVAPISVVSGQNYTVTFTAGGGANTQMDIGTQLQPGGQIVASAGYTQGSTYTVQFTAAATTTYYLRFTKFTNGANPTVSNVSVRRTYVTNGDFALDPVNAAPSTVQNGWSWFQSAGTGTVTYASGAVTLTGDGTNFTNFDTNFPTVVGTTYTLMFDLATAGLTVNVGTSAGSTVLGQFFPSLGVNQTFQFTATTTTTYIRFNKQAASASVLDNVRVRSAGVLPTNWFWSNGGTGVSREVVAVSAESGIPYTGLRFFGAATATALLTVGFMAGNEAAAATGQIWDSSQFQRLAAGSLTGLSGSTFTIAENTSAGSFVAGANYTIALPTSAGLATQRVEAIRSFTGGATVAAAQTSWKCTATTGNTVDATIYFGAPQLEQVTATTDKASSVILTYGATYTRSADVPSVANPPNFRSNGTIYADAILNAPKYGQSIVADGSGSAELGAYGATGDLFQSYDGTSVTSVASTTVAANTRYKMANAFSGSTRTGSVNGSAPIITAFDGSFTGTTLYIGSTDGTQGFLNGWIRELRIYTIDKGAGVQAMTV